MRNSKSGLSLILGQVKTTCRIVLTGTPLQNNLLECEWNLQVHVNTVVNNSMLQYSIVSSCLATKGLHTQPQKGWSGDGAVGQIDNCKPLGCIPSCSLHSLQVV